jgi:hypothetical protein
MPGVKTPLRYAIALCGGLTARSFIMFDQSAGGAEFVLMARSIAKARGQLSLAATIADATPGGQRVASILRAAMPAGTVADA